MKLTLFQKVFGAIFITSVLMVILMVGAFQYSVASNFKDYVDTHEMLRWQGLIKGLEAHYATHRNWDQLEDNPRLWSHFIVEGVRRTGARLNREKNQRFGRENPRFRGNHPPPVKRFEKRLSLFHVDKQVIVGRMGNPKKFIFRPILFEGKPVAFLGLRKLEQLSNPIDASFLNKHIQGLYWIGGVILILGLLMSFLISSPLVANIRRIAEGAKKIAARQFGTRIEVHSRDELGQLATDFNQMSQTLENYENSRKQWISDVSHELGTPLSIVQGGLEAMIDGVRELSPENLNNLHAQVLHLSQIANDLRLLSLADTGGLTLDRRVLAPEVILQDMVLDFEDKFRQHNIEIAQELQHLNPSKVSADAQRLKQLFSNILENSLRYVDKPGCLTIGSVPQDSHLTLFFEDTGPGVPEEALPHLFERLYRVDGSRRRVTGGSGLGLAICKQIVNVHDGSIVAKNTDAGGLRIEITLPMSSDPQS